MRYLKSPTKSFTKALTFLADRGYSSFMPPSAYLEIPLTSSLVVSPKTPMPDSNEELQALYEEREKVSQEIAEVNVQIAAVEEIIASPIPPNPQGD